ncbi:MAG: DUF4255 domain-containing protein [Rhodobacterales bacterium]|nr:DUF4255 domain-containing protein [Rhodobacterales bacterium]
MSDVNAMVEMGQLPPGFTRGPMQGREVIGEITENLQKFILEGWDLDRARPRISEDLSFVPKDRQEVIYVYMYQVSQTTSLKNAKRWRATHITKNTKMDDRDALIYERPPIYLDVHYIVTVHSKFRSDAERLLGWTMLRLWEAANLIYRPRRYTLPDGTVLDSSGEPWSVDATGENVIMEKVSLAMVDDLPISDAINFFTIHQAPYRPYLTFRARCSMEGSLVRGPATTVVGQSLDNASQPAPKHQRPNGRMSEAPAPKNKRPRIGPSGFNYRPTTDDNNEDNSNKEE